MANWYRVFMAATVAGLLSSQDARSQQAPSLERPAESQTSPTPSQQVPEQQSVPARAEITCPPGQFPSAFSDVRPDHWAYEAVMQLASPEVQCFPDEPQR